MGRRLQLRKKRKLRSGSIARIIYFGHCIRREGKVGNRTTRITWLILFCIVSIFSFSFPGERLQSNLQKINDVIVIENRGSGIFGKNIKDRIKFIEILSLEAKEEKGLPTDIARARQTDRRGRARAAWSVGVWSYPWGFSIDGHEGLFVPLFMPSWRCSRKAQPADEPSKPGLAG